MKKLNLLLSLGILFASATFAGAQTTISNTPSTDVVEARTFYGEVGIGDHFARYRNGGFQAYGLKALYGLTRNVEVGANVAYTKNGALSPVEFSPNVKWKAYSSEKHKVAVTGGAVMFVPVRAEEGAKTTAMVYANASKAFDQARGFRLTGGVYKIVGAGVESGNRKGVMVGYEQTLWGKTSLFADWTSGKNRFGAGAIGVSIPFKKKNVFYAGYNIGNSGRGNNWLSVTVGRFF